MVLEMHASAVNRLDSFCLATDRRLRLYAPEMHVNSGFVNLASRYTDPVHHRNSGAVPAKDHVFIAIQLEAREHGNVIAVTRALQHVHAASIRCA
jgi:hypothetical protein